MSDRELVVAEMARALLPGWLAGFIIAGILAAIMSTADSQLLVATSAVVQDVTIKLFGVELSKAQVVRASRFATLAITGVALLPLLSVADGQKFVDTIVAYAWGGLGATFGPALILALWWKKTSGRAVLAGMVTGILATIVWKNVPGLEQILDLKIAAFALATEAVVLVSALWPDRRPA
jgi:Na+/proline symporter